MFCQFFSNFASLCSSICSFLLNFIAFSLYDFLPILKGFALLLTFCLSNPLGNIKYKENCNFYYLLIAISTWLRSLVNKSEYGQIKSFNLSWISVFLFQTDVGGFGGKNPIFHVLQFPTVHIVVVWYVINSDIQQTTNKFYLIALVIKHYGLKSITCLYDTLKKLCDLFANVSTRNYFTVFFPRI